LVFAQGSSAIDRPQKNTKSCSRKKGLQSY
jgi:hypothetical protein